MDYNIITPIVPNKVITPILPIVPNKVITPILPKVPSKVITPITPIINTNIITPILPKVPNKVITPIINNKVITHITPILPKVTTPIINNKVITPILPKVITPITPILPKVITPILPKVITPIINNKDITPIINNKVITPIINNKVITPIINNKDIIPIIPKLPQQINNGCGFTNWRTFKYNNEVCQNRTDVTESLRKEFIKDIMDAKNKNQEIILLVHKGDAVKNMTNDQETAYKIYNVIPNNWNMLSYEEKADIMRLSPKEIDYKRWSRQQWPYNTIRYVNMRRAKFIYIQSDYNYCRFPSMFAEAMCGTLYTKSTLIDDLYYHFEGNNHSLYCVGEYTVADELLKIATSLNVVPIPEFRNDFEWANMSDEFLYNIYTSSLHGGNKHELEHSYVYYPWDLILERYQREIVPMDIILAELMGNKTQVTATYVSDLCLNNIQIIRIDGKVIPPSFYNIPMSWLTDKVMIYLTYGFGVVQFEYIRNNIRFEGTYNNPKIFINNIPLPREVIKFLNKYYY